MNLFGELERYFGDLHKLTKFKDLSELKDKGEVTEETEEEGDIITRRVHYRSFDGRTELHRTYRTTKAGEKYSQVFNLRRKINNLLREDKFEDAIPLRDELKTLESELKSLGNKKDK